MGIGLSVGRTSQDFLLIFLYNASLLIETVLVELKNKIKKKYTTQNYCLILPKNSF